jgi:hypothetical protein
MSSEIKTLDFECPWWIFVYQARNREQRERNDKGCCPTP